MTKYDKNTFIPLPTQKKFLEATEPELMYSASFATGKTEVGCVKALFLSQFYPGNVGLICRKTASDIPSSTLKTLLENVVPPENVILHNKTEKRIVIRTDDPKRPSEIYYRGLDRPVGIASMNLGWVFVDEGIEITEEDWAMLEGRLRLNRVPFYQIFTCTNPGSKSHWLYRRFYQEKPTDPKTGKPIRKLLETNTFENIHLRQEYKDRLSRFTGLHYQRYVMGEWVGFEGLVYPQFDPTKHIIDPFEIPDDWARYRVIDFGTVNPTTCLYFAEDPKDGALYMYREWYMSGKTITEHAKVINDYSQGEKYQATISDHGAEWRLEFEKHGIYTTKANKDIQRGIEVVASRLQPNKITGKPTLFFFRDSLIEEDPILKEHKRPTSILQEFGKYVWAKGSHDTMKDEPLKKDDHGCFVADTLVTTPNGQIPIVSLRVGDMVMTRYGPRRVIDWAKTGINKPVVKATFSNGTSFICTPKHKVWHVSLNRFMCIDDFNIMDMVLTRDDVTQLTNIEPYGNSDVYNITVKDQHEFYANGVLVRNCDALRYLCMALEENKKWMQVKILGDWFNG